METTASWQYWSVVAAWVIWEIYWGLSARGVKRAAAREPFLSRLPVLIALLAGIACMLVPQWISAYLARPFLPQGGIFFYLGYAILVAGLSLGIWARSVLGRNWSGRVTIKEGHELVTAGPYALVRHPIYSGALLINIGSAIALGWIGGLVAIVLFAVVFVRKIRLEERMLGGHFGEKYAEYRKRTNALIPFIF